MAIYVPLITADLARAARALAQVSLLDLAEHTGLDADLLRDVERGLHSLTPPQEERLHLAFEDFGVELLPADDDAGIGHGVGRKLSPGTGWRLENWEHQGAAAAADDICAEPRPAGPTRQSGTSPVRRHACCTARRPEGQRALSPPRA